MSDETPGQRGDDDGDDRVETVAGTDPPDDTRGGPLSSGAGEGSGQAHPDAPDLDVPGGADEGV
jgi:hypothetical protein